MNQSNLSPDLLPCPFCGGAANPYICDIPSAGDYIMCDEATGCGVMISRVDTKDGDLIGAWNRRATPPSPSTAPEVFDPAKRTGRQLMDQWNAGAHEVAERDAFEAWAREPIRAEKLPLDRWPTNDGYKDTRTYIAFYGWKSGRAALASRPAEVDDEGLPPLPPEAARAMKSAVAFFVKWQDAGKELRGALLLYTAEQYRQGQRDAVAADRARRGDRT